VAARRHAEHWFPEPASIRHPVPIGIIPETGEPMELVLWNSEGGKAIGIYSMTGGCKTNLLDGLRERITAVDDAVLVQLNAAGSGDELSWQPLAAMTAAGLQADDPGLRQRIIGALHWARHLIGERSGTAVHTGESVFQPTREDPAVVVMIDETGTIEGASKLLEFLASKQRKSAVSLVLAGQRATSTVVTGLLARDSESRHAVGAENEIPDIGEYSRGQAGFWQVWDVRAKRIRSRGRAFYMGKIGAQQDKIIARRDPAARPALEGAGEITATAPTSPQEQPGSALRERLAHIRELNEGRPLPAGPGALPVVPGVPRLSWRWCSPCWPRGNLGLGRGTGPGYLEDGRVPSPVGDARLRGGRAGRHRAGGRVAPGHTAGRHRSAVHHHRRPGPGRSRGPCGAGRRAADSPRAGPGDRQPTPPDPPAGRRRWRTVTLLNVPRSFRETFQERSTTCSGRGLERFCPHRAPVSPEVTFRNGGQEP